MINRSHKITTRVCGCWRGKRWRACRWDNSKRNHFAKTTQLLKHTCYTCFLSGWGLKHKTFQSLVHNQLLCNCYYVIIIFEWQSGAEKLTWFLFQNTDSCCFLRQLLRFYIEKVFSGYTSSQSLHQRTTSVLANSFLSITKTLQACVCRVT